MGLQSPWPLLERMAIPEDVAVLVVNQCPERAEDDLPADIDDGRVRMRSFAERGLARSRNRALDLARGEIVLLADSDCHLIAEAVPAILGAFESHPDCGVVSFQYAIDAVDRAAKTYPVRGRDLGRFSIVRVSSVEIALRRSAVGPVRFDERFGPGAVHPMGSENVFLAKLGRRGVRMRFEPLMICVHVGATRGAKLDGRIEMAEAVGPLLAAMYPRLWPLAAVASAIGQGSRGVGRWRRLRWFVRVVWTATRFRSTERRGRLDAGAGSLPAGT